MTKNNISNATPPLKIRSKVELRDKLEEYMADGKPRRLGEIYEYISPLTGKHLYISNQKVASALKSSCAVIFSNYKPGGSVWVIKEKKDEIMGTVEELYGSNKS